MGVRVRAFRTTKAYASAVKMALALRVPSPFARFLLVKAWNVCSHCIPPISTASPSCVVAAFVAPNCTTCAPCAVSPHVSVKMQTTKPKKPKERYHEKRYSPRLPLHRRQNDRWYRPENALHLG